jgi:hypothetical protein
LKQLGMMILLALHSKHVLLAKENHEQRVLNENHRKLSISYCGVFSIYFLTSCNNDTNCKN